MDTGFLLAGALTAAAYFDRDVHEEHQIRTLADELYRRADWRWAQHGEATLTHGYRPRTGFLTHRWKGYDEALLLYVLALGSPTYPLPDDSYPAWLSTDVWKKLYDYESVYAGPPFIHQLSHIWIDFRGIQDVYMRDKGLDYFEHSRPGPATLNVDGVERACFDYLARGAPHGPDDGTIAPSPAVDRPAGR